MNGIPVEALLVRCKESRFEIRDSLVRFDQVHSSKLPGFDCVPVVGDDERPVDPQLLPQDQEVTGLLRLR